MPSKEISVSLVCVVIRNGIEIWVEKGRAENLEAILGVTGGPQFFKYEGRWINRADVVGVFTPADMEDRTRRKNGQWRCTMGTWHDREQDCSCRADRSRETWAPEPEVEVTPEQRERNAAALAKIRTDLASKKKM